MKKKTYSARLSRVELLENRNLMAGNVMAALEGSLIVVEGDNLDNQIAITRNLAGDVVVAGQNGTLINGLPTVRFPRVDLNAIEIRMEGGNDTVAMRGLRVANDAFVDLGLGDDRLTVPASSPVEVLGNFSIFGSGGSDVVQLNGITVREDLSIDGGIGALNVSINNATVDKVMSIVGDEANDILNLVNVQTGLGTLIETKGGSDRVNLSDVRAFSIAINTDSNGAVGLDQVTLNRINTVEDLGIFTGAGNDVVRMSDVFAGKSITVSLDEGNDRVIATRVTAAEDAVFEGGAGLDILENYGISGGTKREFKEFETVL